MYNPQHRLWLLSFGAIFIIGILSLRLADIQLLRLDYYQAVAASQRQKASELAAHRGTIYVQEGRNNELFPVAVNSKAKIAYAVPRKMDDPQAIANELAPALLDFRRRQQQRVQGIISTTGQATSDTEENLQDQEPNEGQLAALIDQLTDKFNRKTDPYEPFLLFYEVLDDELERFLEDKQLEGIIIEEQETRTYPEKTLAAHVLGYVGWQDDQKVGRYGIEGYFEELLTGDQGFLTAEHDTQGRLIGVGSREFRAAQDGVDITLTIDRVVQSIIEGELADGVERYGAERGTITVMDPATGAILGMAAYPTFDPNYYYAINDARVQLNPTVSELFEPGSILKPIIMASALEENIVTPDTTFVDNGPVRVAEYTIDTYDGQHHGLQTMTQVLEKSNNVGMIWVGQQLGAEVMYDYFRRFGLGEKTGVKLSGETQSALLEPGHWNITTVATASFGQGIAMTPLQSLNAVSALANDGMLMQPHIVSSVRRNDEQAETVEPILIRQVVSGITASQVSAMLVSVIENGVAQLARVPGYYLAGKTGTAQVPDSEGGYSPDQKIISFIGYGPVSNPRFSILIKLDNPSGLTFASGTTAPMFSNIAEQLLQYYQIPPDYDPAEPQPQLKPPSNSNNQDA